MSQNIQISRKISRF